MSRRRRTSNTNPEMEVARSSSIEEGDLRGTITIAPDVLLQLLELTVGTVDGVECLGSSKPKRAPTAAPSASAKTYASNGLSIVLDGDQLVADVAIVARVGVHVQTVGRVVQEQVVLAVAKMLGMEATEVNVEIADIGITPVAPPASSS